MSASLSATLNRLLAASRDHSPQSRPLGCSIFSRLETSLWECHETVQQTRFVIEGDGYASREAEAVRAHLLEIEAGFCNLAEMICDLESMQSRKGGAL